MNCVAFWHLYLPWIMIIHRAVRNTSYRSLDSVLMLNAPHRIGSITIYSANLRINPAQRPSDVASLCVVPCSHHSSTQHPTYHPGPGSLQGRSGGQAGSLQGQGPGQGINQSRNSVKFASPVRYSANSDIVDPAGHTSLPLNGLGPVGSGQANLNLSSQTSKETSDALALRSVASTFPFVEPQANGNNGIGNGGYHGAGGGYQGGYDPSLLVEDKWNLSGAGAGGQPQTNGVGQAGGQASQNGNGVKRSYNDNDHYLRYLLLSITIIYMICFARE